MADNKQQEEATENFEVVTDEAVGQVEEPEQDNSTGEDGDQEDKGKDSAKAQEDNETDNDGEQDQANNKDDNADNADDAGAKDDKPKPKRQRFQKRIDRLTRERAEAERRAEEAERRLRELEQGKGNKPKGKPSSEEPDPADFESYSDYLDALSEWKANDNNEADNKGGDDSGKGDKDDKGKEEKPDPEFEEALAEVNESFAETKARYKDFDEVISQQDLAITADMVKAMAEADEPGEIAYYLGKNKSEAARIAQLPPLAQAKEIGKLEVAIARGTKQPSKKVTGAPDPIEPVNGGGSSTTKDVKDMSFDEYEQHMAQQEKKRGGGFW